MYTTVYTYHILDKHSPIYDLLSLYMHECHPWHTGTPPPPTPHPSYHMLRVDKCLRFICIDSHPAAGHADTGLCCHTRTVSCRQGLNPIPFSHPQPVLQARPLLPIHRQTPTCRQNRFLFSFLFPMSFSFAATHTVILASLSSSHPHTLFPGFPQAGV